MSETPTQTQWQAVLAASKARQTAQKEVVYNVGTKEEPVEARFIIRMLKAGEKDNIEERGVRIDPSARAEGRVRTDAALLKRLTLEAGIVSGPEGWQGSRSDFDGLCMDSDLRDQLADTIDKFTKLDAETRIGFR